MDRAREQTLLIWAVALAAHAALLFALLAGWAWMGSRREVVAQRDAVTTPVVVMPVLPEADALGETSGMGESIAAVDRPETAVAPDPRDFEQAWTRQRPVLTPAAPAEPQTAASAEARRETAFGPQTTMESLAAYRASREEADRPAEAVDETPVEPKQQQPQPQAPSAEKPDPADQGKSDLDAFAKEEGITYQPGGVKARQGRDVKLTRPRVDLGFMADVTRMRGKDISVKLEIETDSAGNPKLVEIAQTSGSTQIDDAVRLAAYDSWFGGKMPDKFKFTVTFLTR